MVCRLLRARPDARETNNTGWWPLRTRHIVGGSATRAETIVTHVTTPSIAEIENLGELPSQQAGPEIATQVEDNKFWRSFNYR
jgi:hypothetical protein